MNILESFRIAFDALRSNKMRAVLTMLGVIIGVMAVILLVSMGQGVKSDVTQQITGLGSNLLFVLPGRIETGMQHATAMTNRLVPADVELIRKRAVYTKGVVGVIEAPIKAKYSNRVRRTVVVGTDAAYPSVYNRPVVKGRFFTKSQAQSGRRVCILGKTVVDDLFGRMDPVGKQVALDGQKYTVIGVLQEKGRFMGQDFDDAALVPTSAAVLIVGNDRLNTIVAQAENADRVGDAQAEIKRILGKKYTPDDYTVFTQGQSLSILQEILGIMTLMLVGIASISLLVGGIGIMNIMLVSVTERTREIGIRKAVGARTYDIMLQFIIESVSLSVAGGGMGILLGIGGAQILSNWLPAEITAWAVLLSFSFAAVVGIFFGVYPAWKASRLDPIDALRYE